MIVGEIFYPDVKHPRKKLKCDVCKISYSNKSYKNLIENYKLLYLTTFSSEVIHTHSLFCHDCFFDNLNNVVKEYELDKQGMPFFILTKDTELELNFMPSEFAPKGDEQEIYMEDFIKEILES